MTPGAGVPTLASLPAPPAGRSGWPWTSAPPPLPLRRADGSPWPRISIVTGSHDQGAYLEETLRSVLLQGYPNLEYIVVDAGSRDGSPAILRRYARWLAHWEVQADRGQAAALNGGLGRATGAILAYLNSDDTYLPGALARVACEVDARRGRHLVIGRCLFTDAAGAALGREHTSRAVGHWRQLAVWKGHTMPQPASFWSRAAWQYGGPLGEDGGAPWIDYGLFCRLTRRYRVHAVDQLLATYRLHPTSITANAAGGPREGAIPISRLYWGRPWTPRHLVLAASLAVHRCDRLGRARAAVRQVRERRARGEVWRARALAGVTALWAPDLLARLAVERWPARRLPPWLGRLPPWLGRWTPAASAAGPAAAERTRPWPDGWVGPRLRLDLPAAGGERVLRIAGAAVRPYLGAPLALRVRVDGRAAAGPTLAADGPFAFDIPLAAPAAAGRCRVEIEAAPCFVPHTLLGNHDRRHLCWQFGAVGWTAGPPV